MTQGIVLRLATPKDLPAIEQVEDGLFDFPVKRERAQEFLEDPRHHLVLAFDGSRLVGIASAFHYVHPDKEPAMFMNEVGVLEAYRNRGIARAMVKRLYEHAKALGCEEVWIATEYSNLAARRAFTAAGGAEDPEPVVLINF